jgi:hypothetical protein
MNLCSGSEMLRSSTSGTPLFGPPLIRVYPWLSVVELPLIEKSEATDCRIPSRGFSILSVGYCEMPLALAQKRVTFG